MNLESSCFLLSVIRALRQTKHQRRWTQWAFEIGFTVEKIKKKFSDDQKIKLIKVAEALKISINN